MFIAQFFKENPNFISLDAFKAFLRVKVNIEINMVMLQVWELIFFLVHTYDTCCRSIFLGQTPNFDIFGALTAILRDQAYFKNNMVMDQVRELMMAMLFSSLRMTVSVSKVKKCGLQLKKWPKNMFDVCTKKIINSLI